MRSRPEHVRLTKDLLKWIRWAERLPPDFTAYRIYDSMDWSPELSTWTGWAADGMYVWWHGDGWARS